QNLSGPWHRAVACRTRDCESCEHDRGHRDGSRHRREAWTVSTIADGLPPLREVIAEHGLSAKKGLGQNFILDFNLTRRIAREAGVRDKTLYEVGPGPGGLTRALIAEGATRVIAIERDSRCLPALEEISLAKPGKLELVEADALAIDERALLK